MNSKNGFFGLVPPASTAAPAPPAANPMPAPAPAPENAWPLAHSLPLGPGNEPPMLSRDEKHAAWRTAPETRPTDEPTAPRAPSKGELLAAGLRQMRQSQRAQAGRAAGGRPAQVAAAEPRPQTVVADMTWPDQRISVPISPEAQVPSPPMPINEPAAARPTAAAAVSAPAPPPPPPAAPAPVATAPAPMPAAPAPTPAWPASRPTAAPRQPTAAAPVAPAAAWPHSQATPQAQPPAPAAAPAAPVPAAAPAAPAAPEDNDIRRVFARLRGDEAPTPAAPATAAPDPAKARGGFLSRLGKK